MVSLLGFPSSGPVARVAGIRCYGISGLVFGKEWGLGK